MSSPNGTQCCLPESTASVSWVAHEFAVERLRSFVVAQSLVICDSPEQVVDYWNRYISSERGFNSDCEHLVVFLLDSRNRVRGHHVVGLGIVDSVLTHPREVFRAAIMLAASSVVLVHNHPSGDPAPSEADIRATREIEKAGRIVNIELLDHVIVGETAHSSMKTLGYI